MRFSIPLALGIDIGGTKVALALGDEEGRVVARYQRPTEPSGDAQADVARLVDDARRLLAESGVGPGELSCAGVSAPSPIDAERGLILSPPNLPGWRDVPVARPLAEALGVPVHLENDANAAALAEWRFGAARGARHAVYLTMSTGIGAGLILDGRLYRGHADAAGEIGHAPVEWDGELCSCGQRGCLEAYAGGAAWTRRLRSLTPASSAVAELAGGTPHVTPEHVVAAARGGDAFARGELQRWVGYVGRAIVWIAFTITPDVIVLGTIATAAGEELCFAPLREQVAARVWPELGRDLSIVPAGLGDDRAELAGICAAFEGALWGGS